VEHERAQRLPAREIGISFPNNQRQHRTLHIQKDAAPRLPATTVTPHNFFTEAVPRRARI